MLVLLLLLLLSLLLALGAQNKRMTTIFPRFTPSLVMHQLVFCNV